MSFFFLSRKSLVSFPSIWILFWVWCLYTWNYFKHPKPVNSLKKNDQPLKIPKHEFDCDNKRTYTKSGNSLCCIWKSDFMIFYYSRSLLLRIIRIIFFKKSFFFSHNYQVTFSTLSSTVRWTIKIYGDAFFCVSNYFAVEFKFRWNLKKKTTQMNGSFLLIRCGSIQ